jgi:hypothetical protein
LRPEIVVGFFLQTAGVTFSYLDTVIIQSLLQQDRRMRVSAPVCPLEVKHERRALFWRMQSNP